MWRRRILALLVMGCFQVLIGLYERHQDGRKLTSEFKIVGSLIFGLTALTIAWVREVPPDKVKWW